jgi:hypothetical protein
LIGSGEGYFIECKSEDAVAVTGHSRFDCSSSHSIQKPSKHNMQHPFTIADPSPNVIAVALIPHIDGSPPPTRGRAPDSSLAWRAVDDDDHQTWDSKYLLVKPTSINDHRHVMLFVSWIAILMIVLTLRSKAMAPQLSFMPMAPTRARRYSSGLHVRICFELEPLVRCPDVATVPQVRHVLIDAKCSEPQLVR